MNVNDRTERNARYFLTLIFTLMAVGVIMTGYINYRSYERHFRHELERQLSAIAQLKVKELIQWRRERLGDGSILFKNKTFSALARRFLESPKDTDAQKQLQDWMFKYATAYTYAQVTLFDTDGSLRALAPEDADFHDFEISGNVAQILREGRVVFQDFHRDGGMADGAIHLGVVVPIFDEADDSRPLGVLVMDIDPATYFYPFMSHWPTPSQTAETLLVRRDGDDALFLNELKFHKNAPLNLRIPLTKTEVPAVRAALGETGIFEGVDYRGAPVIAATHPVPGSPWAMVARTNTSEVYTPLRERMGQTLTLAGFLLFGAGVATWLVWRQMSARYREREKAAEAVRESEARFRQLADATFEGVLITENGRILDVNNSFLKMAGYEKTEEVVGRSALEFVTPEYSDLVADHMATGYEKPYEIMGIRKDGSTIPIEIHGKTMVIAGRHIRFTAVQDITERKLATEKLRRSEENLSRAQAVGQIGSWFLDIPTNRLEWSAESQRIFGAPLRDPFDLETFVSVLHPDDRDFVLKAWSEAILAGALYDIEHRIVVNGETRWVRERAEIERDPEGRALAGIGTTQDITERKLAEDKLIASQNTLSNAQRIAHLGDWELDIQTGEVKWSDETYRIFGFEPGEIKLKFNTFMELVHPEDREIFKNTYPEILSGSLSGLDFDFRIIRPDGEERILYVQLEVITDKNGKPVKLTGVNLDITERKRAEERRRRSEDLLAEAQKVARIGHWEWDMRTGAVTWSDELFRIFGYEPGAIAPSMDAFMDSVPPEDRERVSQVIKQSLYGGGRYFMDRVVVTLDGTRRIVHAEGEVERDESGAPLRMFAVVQDVTEGRENESRLKLFRDVLNLSQDAVYIMDVETARPVDFNLAAHEQLGYTREEMLALTVFDIIGAKPDEFVWKDRISQVRQKGGLVVERNHRRKDGSLVPVETALTLVRMERKEYLVAVARDLTERMKIREMEIAAKSLEIANHELEDFAHVASHDLQEPLRTIIAFSDRLEAKFSAEFSPKALDYLQRIRSAGMRMSQLMQDLLRYSLVSGGHLNFARVDLNHVVAEALEDMRGVIEESGASLSVNVLPVVSADHSQMRQMFQNLVSNAIKYRKPGEHPNIRIYGIKTQGRNTGPLWDVTVEDDGIGFKNEYAEKIFKVFERLHGHSEYEGTGIGLATVSKIVQRHGWTIKAEGKPGAGSKFTVLMISLEE